MPSPTATRPLYDHRGIGGWTENSAAHVWIVLPNTTVSELEVGETYQAVLPSLGVGDPFYARTEGTWVTRSPKLQNCKWTPEGFKPTGPADDRRSKYRDVLEGTVRTVETDGLSGTVTIQDLTGAHVKGSFELSGDATLSISEYDFVFPDELAGVCEYGSRDVVIGNEGEHGEQRGGITIRGQFTAPASVEISRPGRRIAQTRTVRNRQ